jgi:hypothetical protein
MFSFLLREVPFTQAIACYLNALRLATVLWPLVYPLKRDLVCCTDRINVTTYRW